MFPTPIPPPSLFLHKHFPKLSKMDRSLPSSLFFIFIIFPNLIQLHKPIQADDEKYQKCKSSFKCGNLENIGYPFYDGVNHPEYCGYPGFKLDCSDDKPEISVSLSEKYYLMNYTNSTSNTISVARKDDWEDYCSKERLNTSINISLFSYTFTDVNVTLYYDQCSTDKAAEGAYPFSCGDVNGYFMINDIGPGSPPGGCQRNFFVPVNRSVAVSVTDSSSLQEAFQSEFELEWLAENELCKGCIGSGGVCGSDPSDPNKFTCYCADQPHDYKCDGDNADTPTNQKTGHAPTKSQIIIPVASSAVGMGVLIILVIYITRRHSKINQVLEVSHPKKKQEVETFLRHYRISGPKRYTYTDLRRITNSFKDKLGEGGYGTVHRGRLHNGSLVAVKILKKSKGDPVEFINEVASIGTTNHKNIVTLLGFCYEGEKRALVYDFMPNGSLEKFIYRGNNQQSLAWEKLFQIAIGVARGLEYLHQGCNTRILHFDIKPHNILLDENFCPKISDFGLAKSCPQKESIISMSGARGTVGYIAPEVFLRGFGGVSQKSDVYSYGMLVLDMVGCRKNSESEVECSSEQYFPQWIYKQLEQEEVLDHQEILTDEERELWRKMVLVSLWCIQTSPQSRPTMTRVVEMLEGTSESLQIPPMPTLASPPRSLSQQESSPSHTISIS